MILESGPGNGTVLWMLGSVLLKGVREKEFPEFFEKSIDKQKIDAILNSAVRFLDGCEAGSYPGRKVRFDRFNPDTRKWNESTGSGMCT